MDLGAIRGVSESWRRNICILHVVPRHAAPYRSGDGGDAAGQGRVSKLSSSAQVSRRHTWYQEREHPNNAAGAAGQVSRDEFWRNVCCDARSGSARGAFGESCGERAARLFAGRALRRRRHPIAPEFRTWCGDKRAGTREDLGAVPRYDPVAFARAHEPQRRELAAPAAAAPRRHASAGSQYAPSEGQIASLTAWSVPVPLMDRHGADRLRWLAMFLVGAEEPDNAGKDVAIFVAGDLF